MISLNSSILTPAISAAFEIETSSFVYKCIAEIILRAGFVANSVLKASLIASEIEE